MPHQLDLLTDSKGAVSPEARAVWRSIQQELVPIVGKLAYETCIRHTQLVAVQGNVFTFAVQNQLAAQWLERKCAEAVRSSFLAHVGSSIELVVTINEKRAAPAPLVAVSESARPAKHEAWPGIPLSPHLIFDNFVVGQCNRLAHAAAVNVAAAPGKQYNPLFLHADCGLGKTHLLQAIGHTAKQTNGNLRVGYVSAEVFTHHFITSIRENRADDFRRRCRAVDVWLVDDIQFIASKEKTEEEFFHTLDLLHSTGRQIVISSDRPPRELHLDHRLTSRFENGLLVGMSPPDLETRSAIITKKAAAIGLELPTGIACLLAEALTSNVRVMEGCLTRLYAESSLLRQPIDLALTRDVLSRYLGETIQEAPSPTRIMQLAAAKLELEPEQLRSQKRHKTVAFARQLAMYFCRRETKLSLADIGRLFGDRDHATVLHACGKIDKLIKSDPAVAELVQELRRELRRPT